MITRRLGDIPEMEAHMATPSHHVAVRTHAVSTDFEVTVRLRNNQLVSRRQELGLSQAAAARRIGLTNSCYCAYEGLKHDPRSSLQSVEWKPSALRIAGFYGASPEILWPESVLAVQNPVVVRTVSATHLHALVESQSTSPVLPDENISRDELRRHIREILTTLPPRHAAILRQHYGIDCPEMTAVEIGAAHGLTPQRALQIINKCLRYLRHPSRLRVLSEHITP